MLCDRTDYEFFIVRLHYRCTVLVIIVWVTIYSYASERVIGVEKINIYKILVR